MASSKKTEIRRKLRRDLGPQPRLLYLTDYDANLLLRWASVALAANLLTDGQVVRTKEMVVAIEELRAQFKDGEILLREEAARANAKSFWEDEKSQLAVLIDPKTKAKFFVREAQMEAGPSAAEARRAIQEERQGRRGKPRQKSKG